MNKFLILALTLTLFPIYSFSAKDQEPQAVECSSDIKKACNKTEVDLSKSIRDCHISGFNDFSSNCKTALKKINPIFICLEDAKTHCTKITNLTEYKDCIKTNRSKVSPNCAKYLSAEENKNKSAFASRDKFCAKDIKEECSKGGHFDQFKCLLERHKKGKLSKECQSYQAKHSRLFRQ